ncbi:oxidoreductase [Endozoicomonas montiporae]|uniref:sulfoacetaldehyde reductase (NADPH) n=2 Tax=Endozoicomonas montiporae TaxID=1027273 RepID=A0A081N8F5_9GAMM|nr:SDR family oxidoreductase [Endozoicomonas montiporae]AMO55381.1 oxidoreductase [Endozoicomonas montiporae CL-33]KEQ14728.1 oxidoreductase [Endozoicomonas montiporae]
MSKPLIVVTGASSGIGEAIARAFSAQRHPLLLLARRVERLEALDLPETLCRKVDVTDRVAVLEAVKEAEAKYGPTDCLVNNAGVMLLGLVTEQNPDEWDRMIDVNVKGVLNGIHAVVKPMQARKGGTIINISSVAGIKGFPNHAAYCGTKFAVHGLTETVREEVADDNVRVIVIAPGAVETELLSHTTSNEIKEGYEGWKDSIGGAITPEDIAACVSFSYGLPQNVCVREVVVAATRQQP